ncbi:MAG: DUF1501 domain-containing protein [Sedimentisphaerales bacterium]|nr:DUF1501 domain-containing protein [Sedimentisphaerales bacterium]
MASAPEHGDRDTVLVVVQLSGGNDGLNTVVPYEDDEYGRNRPTLRLPSRELHRIDSSLGFHPRMGAFMKLYKEGYLSVVQGVGYANSDRSHDRAMRIWHTADPDEPGTQTGWLGRAIDSVWDPDETYTPAVFVGPITQPFGLNAESGIVPSIRSLQNLVARQMAGASAGRSDWKRADEPSDHDRANPMLLFLQQGMVRACGDSERIKAAAETAASTAEYPSFGLAESLRMTAQLIRADVGVRIVFVELGGGGIGGFDNHANQLGNHCALLHQLAESVAAFVYDLKRDHLLDRVLLMTFSEFGRTVRENGRRGTGHGAAGPVFLAGGRLRGGLIGTHPSLTDLDNGALKFHTDFRQVYATVLDRWLGYDSRITLGKTFAPLDVLIS